ncbi:hypothetical protein Tco_0067486 [Tanacetum coccineum]
MRSSMFKNHREQRYPKFSKHELMALLPEERKLLTPAPASLHLSKRVELSLIHQFLRSSVVKPIPEVTKDQVHPSCSQSTAPVQPPVGPEPITTPVFEPIVAPVVAPVPNTKPSVSLPYPSRRDNEKSRNQANEQIDKFYEIFKEMSFEISFTDALVLMPKFASTLRTLLGNKEKLTEVARTSNEPV